jgi:glycosyltransferase involved in cell wall biosynthesis
MVARGRIIRTAGVNRAVQAFHRAVFETPALVLRQLIDEEHWKPDPARRIPNRIGYFDEGDHGADFVRRMRELTGAAGLDLEFVQLAGIENEIISQMQQCGVFLALNVGKSPLWGEGGPMSPQEAMACGTVPVCFDINGPWELIQQHYNGVIVSDFTPEAMARELIAIYSEPGRLDVMGLRALEISRTSHSMQARWPDVARFLDLPPE